tara:strand:+ start:855 stop:1226 length:372 start_codon:yes stop_codon:yes gene_type:complete
MLPGFVEITPNINEREIELAKQIANNINRKCIGKENAVSNKRLREAFMKASGEKISDVRMRRMINYIRGWNLVSRLCACHAGYFQAETQEEWDKWKLSMKKRINEMQRILDCASFFNDQQEKL